MKTRELPLVEATPAIERRSFLAGCALFAGAAACSDAVTLPSGGPDASGPDAGSVPDGAKSPDASHSGSAADASSESTCPSNAKDSGTKPAAVALGVPMFVSSLPGFVTRDAGGLYALSAVCTHNGCTIAAAGSTFSCPCHGATYDANGAVTGGPAIGPLVHYALCLAANGNVAVDKSNTVSADTRFSL